MFNFLFNPNGRVSVGSYWLKFLLPYIAILVGLTFLTEVIGEIGSLLVLLASLFYFWPSIAVTVKRLHDRGMTGWWILIFGVISTAFLIVFFVAIMSGFDMEQLANGVEPSEDEALAAITGAVTSPVGIIGLAGMAITSLVQFVIIYILPGTRGENKYGPDPRG